MRLLAVLLLIFTLAAGVYMNSREEAKNASAPMVEDTVESSMAAPARPDIPL